MVFSWETSVRVRQILVNLLKQCGQVHGEGRGLPSPCPVSGLGISHPERSEGSGVNAEEILRCAQDEPLRSV